MLDTTSIDHALGSSILPLPKKHHKAVPSQNMTLHFALKRKNIASINQLIFSGAKKEGLNVEVYINLN